VKFSVKNPYLSAHLGQHDETAGSGVYILERGGCYMENIVFDYRVVGKNLSVPPKIIQNLEIEARNEFPFDSMMAEIHILRAVKAYAKANTRMVAVES
jgi:hypothetical protein